MAISKKMFGNYCDLLRDVRVQNNDFYYKIITDKNRVIAVPMYENIIHLKDGRKLSHRDFNDSRGFQCDFLCVTSLWNIVNRKIY